MPYRVLIILLGILLTCPGCALREVRSKSRTGPEFRQKADRTVDERWWFEQGISLKWDKGVETGLTYRQREIYDGANEDEKAVLLDFSFPLWRAPSAEARLAARVEALQARVVELEAAVQASPPTAGDQVNPPQ